MTQYSHIVISGGGLYGISLLGIFRYFYIENKLKNVKNIAGNSVGSLFCLAHSIGIDIEELELIIKNLVKEEKLIVTKKNIGNIFLYNGILNFNIITNKLKEYFNQKYNETDITFLELSKKFGINLYISATNINTTENIIFSTDNTPNVSIFDATHASITIPYLGIPVLIDGEYYVDGLMSNNFPINIFKNINKDNILGIVINVKNDYKVNKLEKNTQINFIDYSRKLIEILIKNSSKSTFLKYIKNEYANLLIIEDSHINEMIPLKTCDNNIKYDFTELDIDNLILDGFIKAENFFNYIKS